MAPPIYLNGIQSSIYKEKTFMIILISFSILACREDGGKEKKIWNLALLEVLRTNNGCPEITNFLLSFLCFLFPSTGTCSICISLIYCHGLISKKIFACWFFTFMTDWYFMHGGEAVAVADIEACLGLCLAA